jgi:predicted DNA-binding mobile mystery protein A
MIREALGMTTPQLARRLGLTRQSVAALQQREAAGTITLEALRRAAEAMDCEVVYAVVPRVELGQMIRNRAGQEAEDQLARVGHSMRLEAQGVSAAEHDRQVREAADALLRGSRRDLWND